MPSPTAAPETTYHRIADHAAAFARFEAACPLVDTTAAAQEGRKVTQAQQQEYDEAEEAERVTLVALLSDVPPNTVQLRRKVRYLLMHMQDGNDFNREEQELFLTSLLVFSPPSYA